MCKTQEPLLLVPGEVGLGRGCAPSREEGGKVLYALPRRLKGGEDE